MARKCVYQTLPCNAVTVKVYWDMEVGEYISRLYIQGALQSKADYFSGNRTDAIQTADSMAQHAITRFNRESRDRSI